MFVLYGCPLLLYQVKTATDQLQYNRHSQTPYIVTANDPNQTSAKIVDGRTNQHAKPNRQLDRTLAHTKYRYVNKITTI